MLERAIAQLAATRTTQAGLDRLARALDALRVAADARDYEAFTTANGPFHLAIVRIVGNDLLERAVRPLIDVMQRQLAQEMRRREYAPDGTFFDAMYGVHAEVYDALKDHNPIRAAEAMERHFDLIESSLRG